MNKILQYLVVFLVLSTLTSCSPELRPFTTNLLQEGGWQDNELKRIQFYVSDDIVIHRKISNGSNEIVSGTIKMEKGERVEEVRIKRGTPGVFLFRVKDDKFAISFDASSDKRYLMFGPNPKLKGTYVLLASEWQDRRGKVRYDDKFYFTNGDNAWASLMVDVKKFRSIEVSSRTAKGRKVE